MMMVYKSINGHFTFMRLSSSSLMGKQSTMQMNHVGQEVVQRNYELANGNYDVCVSERLNV